MAPVNDQASSTNDVSSSSSSSSLITKLQETTAATRKLQQSLQPYIEILNHPPDTSSTGSITHHNDNDVGTVNGPSTIIAPSEHDKAVAKAIVALTLATTCYLKPHLLRIVNNNKNQLTTSTTVATSASSASQKKQTQQIRLDLNHIRQLLKQVQECHKRKEKQQPNETLSKRRKRS